MSNTRYPQSLYPENDGYTDYDPALAAMADDGAGAASTSRSVAHTGYRTYDPDIATMADDGFGSAPRIPADIPL